MKSLKELRDVIDKIEVTYDYDDTYTKLINACIDYQNETQDWRFEGLFNDYVNYELAEEIAKRELENGGLLRLYYFLGDANPNNDLFKIDGYGNLTDIDIFDLRSLKEEILDSIDNE